MRDPNNGPPTAPHRHVAHLERRDGEGPSEDRLTPATPQDTLPLNACQGHPGTPSVALSVDLRALVGMVISTLLRTGGLDSAHLATIARTVEATAALLARDTLPCAACGASLVCPAPCR